MLRATLLPVLLPVLLFLSAWLIAVTPVGADTTTPAESRAHLDTTIRTTEANSTRSAAQRLYPSWFGTELSDVGQAIIDARDGAKRLLIYLHRDEDPNCREFVDSNLSQKDIAQKLQENFVIASIDIRGQQEFLHLDGQRYSAREFAELLQVQFMPTLIFLTEDAQLALRINGHQPPAQLRIAIDYVRSKAENQWTYVDYLAAHGDKRYPIESPPPPYLMPGSQLKPEAATDRPFALLFEARDCAACDALHADIESTTGLKTALAGLDIYRIDAFSDQLLNAPTGARTSARQLARDLDINYFPSIVFYSPGRREIIRLESRLKGNAIKKLVDYVVSDTWRTERNFQNYLDRGIASQRQ